MQKFCTNCGTPLNQDTFICPNCGALPDSAPNAYEQTADPIVMQMPSNAAEPANAKKKFPWWIVAIAATAVVALTLVFTWQALLMAIAPRAALSIAMSSTAKSTQQRYENAPSTVLSQGAEYLKDGKLSINADVNYAGEQVKAQVDFAINDEKKQTAVGAALSLRDQNMKANIYLDPDFAAVSADFFNNGTYYGVAFETFKEDIRQSIFGESLTETDIDQADQIIQTILDFYTLDVDEEELAKPYKELIGKYIKELDMEKSSQSVSVDGKDYNCSALTYHLSEEDIQNLLEDILETAQSDDQLKDLIFRDSISDLSGTDLEAEFEDAIDEALDSISDVFKYVDFSADMIFYVRNNRVVALEMDTDIEVDEEKVDLIVEVSFGLKATSDIVANITIKADGETGRIKLISQVTDEDNVYKETLTAEMKIPYEDNVEASFTTKWNRSSGKLTLSLEAGADGETVEFDISCKLTKLEEGFELTVDHEDVEDLLAQFGDVELPEDLTFSVSIRCNKGAGITKPEYVNIRQWDTELLQQLQETLNSKFQ